MAFEQTLKLNPPMETCRGLIGFLISIVCLSLPLPAESGRDAWLRYPALRSENPPLAKIIVSPGRGDILQSAEQELIGALGGREWQPKTLPLEDALVIGRWNEVRKLFPELDRSTPPARDGYWLKTVTHRHAKYWLIVGTEERGVLYGTFSLLARAAQAKDLSTLDDREAPSSPVRWASQWDNLDGSIERGYAGRSIFFENGHIKSDLTRAAEYARLLASVGINGCVINNVNADPRLLNPDFIPQLKRVADAFRPWGVRLALSVDLSSPMRAGGLNTFDPLNPTVAAWWKGAVQSLYRQIPDFAGFVIKAGSEGRSGPSQYRRTAADAANVIARALRPHGGILMYRAFVYNHHLDWRDPKADRAKAAYDYFRPLDGKFDDNTVLQIKYGPIDFQVREPASPLFGAMPHTNEAVELQVTQEYTGQQRHLCFLVPMWKQILDFDMHVNRVTEVKDIVSGQVWRRPLGGYNAVVNVGDDENWLGNPLAMANLYGFGRLAWNPNLRAEEIAEEWSRMTFGNEPRVVRTISAMLLSSWHIYESYTGPLGIGTLTDILGSHYGPGIESAERNGWGQWIRADTKGIGMDRTVATGTAFIGQYSPGVQQLYEPLSHCPDELLLFMHHVAYTYVLHSGETVIQQVYDSHYQGADQAGGLVAQWNSLNGLIDPERYSQVQSRLEYQAGHAIVWRDAVVNWFYRISGIPDARGRVGHDPNRIEAEDMQLTGYVPVTVTPWETASGGRAIACFAQTSCSAGLTWNRAEGTFDMAVQYFDLNDGVSRYELLVNDRLVGSWQADDHLPSDKMDGNSSTRHVMRNIRLKPGDSLRIVGYPGGREPAPVDYIEVVARPQSR
jgi:alpha-glucuronidase